MGGLGQVSFCPQGLALVTRATPVLGLPFLE